MAEYADYGPGYNETGRIAGNVTHVLDEAQYAPYSSLESVFQYPDGSGGFGNTAWIDRSA